jgi:PAS domain S-box-containing protein
MMLTLGVGWMLTDFLGRVAENGYVFGILITTVFAFLLLLFFFVLRYKNKSLEMAGDLLKSRDDWKRTFDAVPDLIATIDANHRIISINRAMAERLGLSPQEAVGRLCHELVHGSPEMLPACPHRRAFGSGETEEETLFDMHLNGDFIVTATPLLATDGTVESTIHVMHDIGELKKMEQTLKEYTQRLEFVLEGSNDATWEWDLITDRGILNSRYFEMIEDTPGAVDSTYDFFLETIHPEDVSDVMRRVKDHLEGKTGEYEAHYRMVTRTGKIKNVLGRGKIVRYDEDGRPTRMAGVVTDISEMKRLSDEVNRISNLESIGLLSGGLAHDFNNALNIIYGNISFAKMLAGGDATIADPLTDAEDACERARELGLRLQAFAQGGSPAKETINLPALMEDAARILFNDLQISHTIFAVDDVLPVEAAPRQIRQVFENLLTNAKEAMSAGGTVKIDIENYEFDGNKGLPLGPGHYVCVTVKDDGKGIPEENLPKIFDPYFSTKDIYSQRGLGLGLSICHAILKRHNGHISVESESGIGTRVTLYLPVAVAGGFTDRILLPGSR